MNSFWWGNKSVNQRGINWMKCQRLCTKKKIGGLRFRNLQLFNLAMLGKMGWRLIADPDALVCKVLKAKYYPDRSFLNANCGHNPSYTWSSICASQDLLRSGIRWTIGSGENVKIFQDPWLRKDGEFYIRTEYDPSSLDMRVNELMIPSGRRWDVDFLYDFFDEDEVRIILNMPLSQGIDDKLIWHYTRNGMYSVKSGYMLACELTINRTHGVIGSWMNIWKLKVPPKVEHFVWRAAHDVIPTKANLLRRNINVTGTCEICGVDYENSWHYFIGCIFAVNCWRDAGLENLLVERNDTFKDFMFSIFSHSNSEVRDRACMVLWQIWRDRNGVVWENTYPSSQRSVHHAFKARQEWLREQDVKVQEYNSTSGLCRGWHNLTNGWFKCEVDAAFFPELNQTGAGIIIRDSHGGFVAAKVLIFPGCYRVEEGEAMGMHEVLSWVKSGDLNRVVFVTDCKMVVDAIKSHAKDCSEFGCIIESCKLLLELNNFFKVEHVRREHNVVAHRLARISKNYSNSYVWVEPPLVVEDLLNLPCVC